MLERRDVWILCKDHVRFIRFITWKWTNIKEGRWIPIFVDLAIGFIVCALFSPTDSMAQSISSDFDNFITWLQSIIEWLMGNPAGLKLNKPLNTTMGNFFLYHIYLWRTYITFLKPFLLYSLLALRWIGCVGGITLQVALALDLLSILTVHIYCFYVYAGRLYQLQRYGLVSLWRLFRGKKYNPLRKRVDSAQFDSQQLFLGVLVFTVLVFLLPTVLVYYGVFAGLRLVIYVGQNLFEFMIITIFYNGIQELESRASAKPSNVASFFVHASRSLVIESIGVVINLNILEMSAICLLGAVLALNLLTVTAADLYAESGEDNGLDTAENEEEADLPQEAGIQKRLVGRFGLMKLQSQRTKAFQGLAPQPGANAPVAIVGDKSAISNALMRADNRKMKNCYLSITMCLLRINKKR